jgi:hypothetical protein
MHAPLAAVTTLFNLVALAVSLGLGLDIATRSRLDAANRDIMSRLYIGASAFDHARWRALQGVARALHEMEEAA